MNLRTAFRCWLLTKNRSRVVNMSLVALVNRHVYVMSTMCTNLGMPCAKLNKRFPSDLFIVIRRGDAFTGGGVQLVYPSREEAVDERVGEDILLGGFHGFFRQRQNVHDAGQGLVYHVLFWRGLGR